MAASFNALLKELDQAKSWRRLNKMRVNQTYRFTKQEIILRFFAFVEKYGSYEGHLAKFLNSHMHDKQHAPEEKIEELRRLFTETVNFIDQAIFGGRAPPKLSITVLEALLVGVGRNVPAVLGKSKSAAEQCYRRLVRHDDFSETSLREGLSKKPRVIARLETAIRVFAE